MKLKAWVLTATLLPIVASAQMGPGGGQGGQPGGGGQGGPPGGGPPGADRMAPPRPPKPLKRDTFDKVVVAMFRRADADRNGHLTLAELNAVIAARRETAIRDRFRRIDLNRDGALQADEFSVWQQGMGSVADSETQSLGPGGLVAEVVRPDMGNDAGDDLLARLVEPIGATTIVNADTDSDGRATLNEILAYERRTFDAADKDHDGELTMTEARGPREPGTMPQPGSDLPGRPPRRCSDNIVGGAVVNSVRAGRLRHSLFSAGAMS